MGSRASPNSQKRTCSPPTRNLPNVELVHFTMRRSPSAILALLVLASAAYIFFGLPWYITFTAVDVTSGRERSTGTLFGFVIWDRIHETDASTFIEAHLPQPTQPDWRTCSQHRPFDSTRRCYFQGPKARIAFQNILFWSDQRGVPLPDETRLMQAAIDAAVARKWISVFPDDDSLDVVDIGTELSLAKWVRSPS
jgi:hypothetical protein